MRLLLNFGSDQTLFIPPIKVWSQTTPRIWWACLVAPLFCYYVPQRIPVLSANVQHSWSSHTTTTNGTLLSRFLSIEAPDHKSSRDFFFFSYIQFIVRSCLLTTVYSWVSPSFMMLLIRGYLLTVVHTHGIPVISHNSYHKGLSITYWIRVFKALGSSIELWNFLISDSLP